MQRDLLGLAVELWLEGKVLGLADALAEALQELFFVQLDFSVAFLDRLLGLQREGRVVQLGGEGGCGDFQLLALRLEQLLLLDLVEGFQVELVFGSGEDRVLLSFATVAAVVFLFPLGQFFGVRIDLRPERAGFLQFVFIEQLLGLLASQLVISSVSSPNRTLLQPGPDVLARELGATRLAVGQFIEHLVGLVAGRGAVDAVEHFRRQLVVVGPALLRATGRRVGVSRVAFDERLAALVGAHACLGQGLLPSCGGSSRGPGP